MNGNKPYGQEYDGPEQGAMSDRINTLADRVENNTRLDRHVSALHEMNNSIERANLQLDNLLNKLRGHLPEAIDTAKTQVRQADPPVLDLVDILSEEIIGKVYRYNSMIDELRDQI